MKCKYSRELNERVPAGTVLYEAHVNFELKGFNLECAQLPGHCPNCGDFLATLHYCQNDSFFKDAGYGINFIVKYPESGLCYRCFALMRHGAKESTYVAPREHRIGILRDGNKEIDIIEVDD